MACIVYQTDHKTGVKYAYESVSYWDKEKGQPRSKRKYLGKVDPETGEIIRKKEKAHSADESAEISRLNSEIALKDEEIRSLREMLLEKERQYTALLDAVRKISALAGAHLAAGK